MNDDRYMRMVKNQNADDVQNWFLVFSGLWMLLPLIALLVTMAIIQFCTSINMDLVPMAAFASIPFILVTAFTVLFINDKAPSYGSDLVKWWWFLASQTLYMRGWMSRPPKL